MAAAGLTVTVLFFLDGDEDERGGGSATGSPEDVCVVDILGLDDDDSRRPDVDASIPLVDDLLRSTLLLLPLPTSTSTGGR